METGINCVRRLRNYMSQIIYNYYYNNSSIDNYINFKQIFHLDEHLSEIICVRPENFVNNTFIIDEIKSLLAQSPR